MTDIEERQVTAQELDCQTRKDHDAAEIAVKVLAHCGNAAADLTDAAEKYLTTYIKKNTG